MWFKLATLELAAGKHLGSMESISKSYRINYSGLYGLNASHTSTKYENYGDSVAVTFTFTVGNGFKFASGSTITCGGSTLFTARQDYAAGSTFTATANISASVSVSGTATAVTPDVPTPDPEEPDTPVNYTFTINPTPTSATVTLSATGYSTVSGTGSKSITVTNGTKVNWKVEASGYTTREGDWTINGANETKSITLTAEDAEYVSYIGGDAFNAIGIRVQGAKNALGWEQATSGTSSAATDYLPVSSEDSIWIEYIAVVNNGLASGGFYDAGKNLVAPLYWGTFGIDQAANASAKFVTPENPVTIASVEEEWNCTIAYVRFIAWQAADGNNTGLTNTEARIYYANGEPSEPTYTSYVGEDVFSFNKESFTNTGYTTSGSSSAYASDYLAVTPEQGVWLQYIFTMSDSHRCVGLFDSNKTFIKSITAADFGLSTGGKFQTPGAPVKISSLAGTENVAYVRFVAWTTSDGGRANTEARIYSY